MELNLIKTIVFDLGGVLIDLDRERCIRAFEALGVSNIRDFLNNFRQSGPFLLLEEGKVTNEEFRDQIRQMCGLELTDAQIDDAFMLFLDELPIYKLQMLMELRKKYRVVMLSNTNAVMIPYILEHHFKQEEGRTVNDYFDALYLSYEMKLSKPDPTIFLRLLEQEGLEPAEAMLVDDGAANCEAAAALGMQTYCPQPKEDFRAIFGL